MRKLFTLIAVLALVIGCAHPGAPKGPDPMDLEGETVALVVTSPRSGDLSVFCTATWIGPDTLLTAAHCALVWDDLEQSPAYSTQREAGDIEGDILRTHPLVVVRRDDVADLALLRATKPTGHKFATVAKFEPELGEHIWIMGHPGGLAWTHMEGTVAQYRELHSLLQDSGVEMFSRVMQVSAPIFFGNSGGAAFNADGEIVGVASYMNTEVPSVGFFTATHPIQKFLLGL
jgi:hypothetical protein